MCLIVWLILGLIGGWFVASQGVNNSGASDFRRPPPQSFGSPFRAPQGNDPSEVQPLQKSLNRFGAKAVYTAVLVIDRCPNHP